MRQADILEAVSGTAAGQWGLFTTAQARIAGVDPVYLPRLTRRGVIRSVRYGVYVMSGVPSGAIEGARAEWLATDPARTAAERGDDVEPVVVSHETAARIHGIGDLPAGAVHLTSSRRIQTRQRGVAIHRGKLNAKEWVNLDGLPVTSPRRTLEDLASSGRWDPGQVADLVGDAIHRRLLPRSDVMRSTVLASAVPQLVPAASHAALRARLKNDAQRRGVDPNDAYNTFFRMMFTARLMAEEGWVLKGGTNLYCRLRHARHTLDLDLFREGDTTSESTAAALRKVMDGQRIGRYTFQIGPPHRDGGEQMDTSRVRVQVMDGVTAVDTFNIDLSSDLVLNSRPEVVEVRRGDEAVLSGYPVSFTVRLYPIENQMADKLCAMYSHFGSGPSTRYRDLYDLAMIVDQLPFDPSILAAALKDQQRIRRITLPASITEPAPGWGNAYDKQMRKTPGATAPFADYRHAIATVAAAVTSSRPRQAD